MYSDTEASDDECAKSDEWADYAHNKCQLVLLSMPPPFNHPYPTLIYDILARCHTGQSRAGRVSLQAELIIIREHGLVFNSVYKEDESS